MNKLPLSKPLRHFLKPQTPNSKSKSNLCHLSAAAISPRPHAAEDSLITQVTQLLKPNEKDWNFAQLNSLLFSNPTSPPSPRALFLITRSLPESSKALKFYDYISGNAPAPSPALLSPTFHAVLEVARREPTSGNKLFELYKEAKQRNAPINVAAAVLVIRSLGAAGMGEEVINVFKELHSGVRNTHLRNVVIGVLLKLGQVDDALKVLDEMFEPGADFRVNEFTVDIVVGDLLRVEQSGRRVRDEEIVDLVFKFCRDGVFPNSVVLTKLITALCRNRKINRAWDVLNEVMKLGGAVEAASCNALLTALGRSGDFKGMNELQVKMKEKGIKPNIITFGICINHLCKSRRIDDAMVVFEKMGEEGKDFSAKPDVIIYNTLIDGLCKVGRQEEGLRLMEKMRLQGGCVPNTVTYNCLIDGFNKVGETERGLQLFNKMKEEGILPSVITLNTLIDGLCRLGRLNAALDFFNKMERDGLKGNAVTYTTLIASFSKENNTSMAMKLFDQMLRAGCPTDAKVYYCVITGLCQVGRMDKASFVVSKLKEAGFSLDLLCCNVLINGFCNKNKSDKVHEILEEMESAGVKPDSVTYNTMIAYLSKSGEVDKAHTFLSRMKAEGIPPTVVTLGTLIHAYCLQGNIEVAMKILRDIGSNSKVSPNTAIYNILIDAFCKSNEVEKAISLMDDMKDKGVRPNTATFNALFRGLRKNNLLEKAFQFMDRMVEQACDPDRITMEILTKWLSAVGEQEKLRKFLEGYQVSLFGVKGYRVSA